MFSQDKTILESTVFDISSQTLSTSGYEFEKNFVVDDKKYTLQLISYFAWFCKSTGKLCHDNDKYMDDTKIYLSLTDFQQIKIRIKNKQSHNL